MYTFSGTGVRRTGGRRLSTTEPPKSNNGIFYESIRLCTRAHTTRVIAKCASRTRHVSEPNYIDFNDFPISTPRVRNSTFAVDYAEFFCFLSAFRIFGHVTSQSHLVVHQPGLEPAQPEESRLLVNPKCPRDGTARSHTRNDAFTVSRSQSTSLTSSENRSPPRFALNAVGSTRICARSLLDRESRFRAFFW